MNIKNLLYFIVVIFYNCSKSNFSEIQNKKPSIYVISGPSGSGKTTIVKKIISDFNFHQSISTTSRKARKNERNGIDYYFIDKIDCDTLISGNNFLEYSKNYDNCYGTKKDFVLSKLQNNESVILNINGEGLLQILNNKDVNQYNIITIFLDVDLDTLKKRLKKRNTETKSEILKRLSNYNKELSYKSLYQYVVKIKINDSEDDVYQKIYKIIKNN